MASNIGNSLNNSASRVILRLQGKNRPIFFALNLAFHLENEIQSTMKFLLSRKKTAAKDKDICVFMEIAKKSHGFYDFENVHHACYSNYENDLE